MLTSRGWTFLLLTGLTLFVGVFVRLETLTIVALTALLWFVAEYALFAVRAHSLHRRLRVRRAVWDDRGAVASLWAEGEFHVHVMVQPIEWLGVPFLGVVDHVPFSVVFIDGDDRMQGRPTRSAPLVFHYRIRCGEPGVVRFEGVRVRAADLQGFFFHETFLQSVVEMRVLPPLANAEGLSPTRKRLNLLPPPGVHRLVAPGTGGELLDLRQYQPGDPPRTIAWKVSARRDLLITKLFESEVPIRCTLFVDTSSSVRVPSRGGRALTRLVEIAAGVLQANAAVRDLTGLVLFDERGVTTARPERTSTHLTRMLRRLADAAALEPTCSRTDPEGLQALAYAFAHEVYPELLRADVNDMPWWLAMFASFPGHSRHPRGFFRRLYRNRSRIWIFCATVLPVLFLALNVVFFCVAPPWWSVAFLFASTVATTLLYAAGNLTFLTSLVLGGRQRRVAAMRKRLASILSVRYGIAPGGLATLLEDDDQFSLLTQRFLIEHRVPYSLPLYDRKGRYLFAAPEKIDVLSSALLQAVARGRDNELFVLLADLLELDDRLHPLLKATKLARARHHQVVLVCPWSPGLEPPRGVGRKRKRRGGLSQQPAVALADQVEELTTRRFHDAYDRVRRAFMRLGVPVVCAADDEPVPLILERIDRLRNVGRLR
jgi:uncharacterized protein (DUF58 family)